MGPQKYLFVINRHAGGGLRKESLPRAEAVSRKLLDGAFPALFPKDRTEAIVGVRTALKQGVERVVVVGGDGSVNAAANGFFENGALVNKNAALVVADGGGGCDYYSSLYGQEERLDLEPLLLADNLKTVDIGVARFDDPAMADRYFLNMASVGMSAEITRRRDVRGRWLPNSVQYLLPTVMTLFSYRSTQVRITVDGVPHDHRILTATVSKGRYAGGGMQFGLNTTLTDGAFEVTVIEKRNRLYLAMSLPRIYTDDYLDIDGVIKYRGKRIEFAAPRPLLVEADGEVEGSTDCAFEVRKMAMQVLVPAP